MVFGYGTFETFFFDWMNHSKRMFHVVKRIGSTALTKTPMKDSNWTAIVQTEL